MGSPLFLWVKLRSLFVSSPIFLPYFSHAGWEKYGRNNPYVWNIERTLKLFCYFNDPCNIN